MFLILQTIQDVTFGSDLWRTEAYFLSLTCAASPSRDLTTLVVVRVCFWAWRWTQTDGCRRLAAVTTSQHQSVSCNVISGETQPALPPITGNLPGWEEASAVQDASFQAAATDKQAHWCLFLATFMSVNSQSDDRTSHTSAGREVLLFPWQPAKTNTSMRTGGNITPDRPGWTTLVVCCVTTKSELTAARNQQLSLQRGSTSGFRNHKHISEALNGVAPCTLP